MPRNFAQRQVWWWTLALAVFVLSAFATIMLSAGTAHAEGGDPSPAGESQAKDSPAAEAPASSSQASSSQASSSPASSSPAQAPTEPAAEPEDGTEPERSVPLAERPKNRSMVRHTETVVVKKDAQPKPERPQPDALDEPTAADNDASPSPKPSDPPSAREASNVVVLPTALPKTFSANASPITPHQKVEQFVRQVVGLISDAGIVGASLVNNLAVQTARTIGPQPFWGLPYTVATAVADSAANVSKVLSGTPLDATSVGPFKVDYGVLDVLSFFTPTKVPAGANDSSIAVSAAHPLPVILVNGTVETQSLNWSVGAPVLANAGYKVYTFNYGNVTPYPNYPIQSTADIRTSAAELDAEIDRVLKETRASKVILIGHSQGGGILPVYYLNELGGADKVSQLIGLAPSNHGTDFNGLVGLQNLPIIGPLLFAASDLFGPALGQQVVTSPFQQVVYGDGDTTPGVLYTTIASTNDEVVTPYTQQALNGPAVTNIVLQDQYPGLPAGHVGVAFIPQTWSGVLDALAANPEANPLLNPLLAAA